MGKVSLSALAMWIFVDVCGNTFTVHRSGRLYVTLSKTFMEKLSWSSKTLENCESLAQ